MKDPIDFIRQWYHQHKVPFDEEDWGERSDVGESIGPQHQRPQRPDLSRTVPSTPDRQWWWDREVFPWHARTMEEREWLLLLEDFFAPYLAMLPRNKGNLVRSVFGDLMTYEEAGKSEGISRQGAQQATTRAVQDLTRMIAEDDALFRPPADARERNFEEEARAARRVFMLYLAKRRDA